MGAPTHEKISAGVQILGPYALNTLQERMEREAAERRAACTPTPQERVSLAALSPQQVCVRFLNSASSPCGHNMIGTSTLFCLSYWNRSLQV